MGCDIHMVVERKTKNGWVTVNIPRFPSPATSRNYQRFAALAGVRGDGPSPRGVPDDASDTAKFLIEDYGRDGHSHSWLSAKEAAPIFLETHWFSDEDEKRRDYITGYPASFFFGIESEVTRICPTCKHVTTTGLDDYRIVFWFDN